MAVRLSVCDAAATAARKRWPSQLLPQRQHLRNNRVPVPSALTLLHPGSRHRILHHEHFERKTFQQPNAHYRVVLRTGHDFRDCIEAFRASGESVVQKEQGPEQLCAGGLCGLQASQLSVPGLPPWHWVIENPQQNRSERRELMAVPSVPGKSALPANCWASAHCQCSLPQEKHSKHLSKLAGGQLFSGTQCIWLSRNIKKIGARREPLQMLGCCVCRRCTFRNRALNCNWTPVCQCQRGRLVWSARLSHRPHAKSAMTRA